MSDPERGNWPPIIWSAELPAWVVWRDVTLTVLLWGTFLYGVVINLDVAWQALQWLAGRPVEILDPLLVPFLGRMGRRITIVFVLVSVLAVATLVNRRRHERALLHPQPDPAPDRELARDLGLCEQKLRVLRQTKIVTLDVDSDGKVLSEDIAQGRDMR
jgi:hypothetical protein